MRQPPPQPSQGDVWLEVIKDAADRAPELLEAMAARRKFGADKYGTVLQTRNGRDFVQDAEDEMKDATVYLKGAALEGYAVENIYRQQMRLWLELRQVMEENGGKPCS